MQYPSERVLLNSPSSLIFNDNVNYCQPHPQVQNQNFCKEEFFWIQKAQHDFNISPDTFMNTSLPPAERYLQLLTERGGIAQGSERYISSDEFMRRAIRQDKRDLVQYLLNQGYKNYDFLLEEYAVMGDLQLVNFFLQLTQNYQAAAEGALKGRHWELFNQIMRMAQNYQWDWQKLAEAVAISGSLNMLKYIINSVNYGWIWQNLINTVITEIPHTSSSFTSIQLPSIAQKVQEQQEIPSSVKRQMLDYIRSKAPSNYPWHYYFNGFFSSAVETKQKDMFDYLRSWVPNPDLFYNLLALAAIRTGQRDVFDDLRSMVPQYNWDWQQLASQAVVSNEREIFDYIRVTLAPRNYNWDWNRLAEAAIGNKEFFDYVRSLAPRTFSWSWNWLAYYAISRNQKLMFDYLMSLAPAGFDWDWNFLLKSAIDWELIEFFDYIRELIPPSYNINWTKLAQYAIIMEQKEMLKHILSTSIAQLDLSKLAKNALKRDNEEMFNMIIMSAPSDYSWNWNLILRPVVKEGDIELFDKLRHLIPLNYNINWDLLIQKATNWDQLDMINHLRSFISL